MAAEHRATQPQVCRLPIGYFLTLSPEFSLVTKPTAPLSHTAVDDNQPASNDTTELLNKTRSASSSSSTVSEGYLYLGHEESEE